MIEVRRDPSPLERVLEQADVRLGRPQQDGHLVEPDAARRFLQDAPRDLDAFARLARRGEPRHLAGRFPPVGRLLREQVPVEPGKVRVAGLLAILDWDPGLDERLLSRDVAGRERHERTWRTPAEREQEPAGHRGVERDVEKHDRDVVELARALEARDRGFEKGRAIVRVRGVEQPLDPFQEIREVGAAARENGQAGRRRPVKPQLRQRRRQRARKAGRIPDGCQIAKGVVSACVVGRPRRERFVAEPGDRRPALRGEIPHRQARRDLGDRQPMHAERHAARERHGTRAVVDSSARRADEQDLVGDANGLQEFSGGGQADAGRAGAHTAYGVPAPCRHGPLYRVLQIGAACSCALPLAACRKAA